MHRPEAEKNLHIAHLDLGRIYEKRKEYPQAVAALKEAIRIEPSRADAHYRLALTYQAMGKTKEAEAESKLAQQLQAKTREVLLHKVSGEAPKLPVE